MFANRVAQTAGLAFLCREFLACFVCVVGLAGPVWCCRGIHLSLNSILPLMILWGGFPVGSVGIGRHVSFTDLGCRVGAAFSTMTACSKHC